MKKTEIVKIQKQLATAGFYNGQPDGIWGPMTQAAWDASLDAATLRKEMELPTSLATELNQVAWSAKVSSLFIERVVWICQALGMPDRGPDYLMSCMAFETGESFSPSVKNALSGATGLIQFMPATARGLGTTIESLAKMTAEDQLNYVYKYFSPYKGRLKTLGDVYGAILWPAAIGKSDEYVLWREKDSPTTYFQNRGLDVNKNGIITRKEFLVKINEKLDKGLRKPYCRVLTTPT